MSILLQALAGAPRAQTAEQLVTEGRSDLLDWRTWPDARAKFERALVAKGGWYHPFARIGIASLTRCGGDPNRAIAMLDRVARAIANWPRDQRLVQQVIAELHEERARCFLVLGLLDRAEVECDAFRAHADQSDPVVRFTVQALRIDLLLADNRAREARRLVEKALAEVGSGRLAAERTRDLEMRRLLAEGRTSRDPVDLKRIAGDLEVIFRDTAVGSPMHARTGLDAVEALLLAGDHARARELSAELMQPPFESPHREAEIAALHARVALASGAGREELAAMRAGLEATARRWLESLRAAPLRVGGVSPFQFEARREVLAALLALDHAVLPAAAAASGAFAHIEAALSLGTVSRRLGAQPLTTGEVAADLLPLGGAVVASPLASPAASLVPRLATAAGAAIEEVEAALSLGPLARRRAAVTPTLDETVAQLVPAGGGMIAYFVSRYSVHLVVADAGGAELCATAVPATFVEDLAELTRIIDHLPGDEVAASAATAEKLASSIAARILPPAVARRIAGWTRVLLLGDERWVAAWQTLPVGGRPLALAKPVAHLPSASLGFALSRRRALRPRGAVADAGIAIVGDPDVDPEVARHWGVEAVALSPEQRRRLASAGVGTDLGKARVSAYWGRAATPAVFGDAVVHGAGALVVVAHGITDYDRERSAGIVLATASGRHVVFSDDVEHTKAPPIVVLGVCESASGPRRVGEDGTSHLGGAFLVAGSDCVLLASGQLPVGPTVDLFALCVAELRDGVDVATALQRARARIAADPARAHPYCWAGLRVLGLGFTPERGAR